MNYCAFNSLNFLNYFQFACREISVIFHFLIDHKKLRLIFQLQGVGLSGKGLGLFGSPMKSKA